MKLKHLSLKYYQSWDTLPDPDNLINFKKPISSPSKEKPVEEYTEASLRTLVLMNKTDVLTGLAVSSESILSLPDNYVLEHYMHIRYGTHMSSDYMPIRIDNPVHLIITTALHSLSGLVCVALVLKPLLEKTAMSIDPAKIKEARNIALLLKEVEYAIYRILVKYPGAIKSNSLVVGAYKELIRSGNYAEETMWILLDDTELTKHLAKGNTLESTLEHWVKTGKQPNEEL